MDFNVTFESQKQDFSVSLASEDAAFELAGETQQSMTVTMDEDDASFSAEFETGAELLSTEFGEVTVIERGGVRVEIEETETGATITVRDDKGTSVAEIHNGRDGVDGQPGVAGSSGKDGKNWVPVLEVGSDGHLYQLDPSGATFILTESGRLEVEING